MSASSLQQGHTQTRPQASHPLGPRFLRTRGPPGRQGTWIDPAFEGRPPRDGSAPEPNRVPPPQLGVLGRATVARRPLEQFAVEPIDVAVLGTAQPDRTLDQGLQDRLDVDRWSSLISFKTSLVAVCCSSASVRSRFRASSSREQPHVLDGDDGLVGEGLEERDLLGGEGTGLGSPTTEMTPRASPSRSSGVARMCDSRRRAWPRRSGNSASAAISSTWIVRRSRTARPARGRRPGQLAQRQRIVQRRSMPRNQPEMLRLQPKMADVDASHSRAAFSATASMTGWRSVGELAITRRISLVAVCCSSASVSSRFRVLELLEQPDVLDGDDRLVGEGLEEGDLLVGEGLHLEPPTIMMTPMALALAQQRRGQHGPVRSSRLRVRAPCSGNSASAAEHVRRRGSSRRSSTARPVTESRLTRERFADRHGSRACAMSRRPGGGGRPPDGRRRRSSPRRAGRRSRRRRR